MENGDYFTIDLPYLAKKLKTNRSYLSKVINSQKGLNFTSYLNKLRINHIIELLEKDPTYRQYTINALSEYTGYTTSRQFSDAFFEETELKVSYFLKRIQRE
ncbi:MAG TPA: helix-turn-helix domain-containing protein [Moheibacter sp.]|nr:helix-turn-helix domain-containing protein [Moheibacter sp.]